MSHLTSKTKVIYVAVIYDQFSNYVGEGPDCDLEEYAIETGQEMVADAVKSSGEYHYAKIETKILPIYM